MRGRSHHAIDRHRAPGCVILIAVLSVTLGLYVAGPLPPAFAQDNTTAALSISPRSGPAEADVEVRTAGLTAGTRVVIAHPAGTTSGRAGADGVFARTIRPIGCAPQRLPIQVLIDPGGLDRVLRTEYTVERPACHAVELVAGTNVLAYGGPSLPIEAALRSVLAAIDAVWWFDDGAQTWRGWIAGAPDFVQSLRELMHDRVYLISSTRPVEWVYELPVQPHGTAAGTPLAAGLTTLRYGGPTLEVTAALTNALDRVLAAWWFDGAAQAWRIWSPQVPSPLRGFDRLVHGEAYLLTSATAVDWRYAAFPVSAADADTRVIQQVIRPENLAHDLIAFRHPEPLAAGDQVRPASGSGGFAVEAPSFLYWIDDDPAALFAHPVRFVLVDRTDGSVRVADEEWWIELNGRPLWQSVGAYWSGEDWAFSRLDSIRPPDPPTAAESQHRDRLRAADFAARVPAGECIIIVNGTHPEGGEPRTTVDIALATDTSNWAAFAQAAGYARVEVVEPPENTSLDLYRAVARVATDPDCEDVTLVLETHGGRNRLLMGGDILSADQIAGLLALFDEVRFKVLIEACYSGSLVDELTALPNVEIVITATDGDSVAHSDQDFTEEDRDFFVFDVADPNPDDEGSEFMSGLLEDLDILMSSDEAVTSMRDAASQNDVGFVPVLYHCAFVSAIAKDFDALNGVTHPQRSLELRVRTQVGTDPYGVPIYQLRPYRCPSPVGFTPEVPG